MTPLQGLIAALSAIVLLLTWLRRVTANRLRGFLIGAAATAVLQSSSAITALAVTLVDAGVISFRASLGVLLGANVGTTATAWLVSFKLTGIGPAFIVLGALISTLSARIRVIGKAVFYFGLIFFALDLISAQLKPLQHRPQFQEWLTLAETPWMGAIAGIAFTALVQSSSVTAGLAILMVQQATLPPQAAIPIVIGAAVGSTSTALMACFGMSVTARATAIANLLFTTSGMVVFLPFPRPFARMVLAWKSDPGMALALAHSIFSLTTALGFLLALDWIVPRLRRLTGASGKDLKFRAAVRTATSPSEAPSQ